MKNLLRIAGLVSLLLLGACGDEEDTSQQDPCSGASVDPACDQGEDANNDAEANNDGEANNVVVETNNDEPEPEPEDPFADCAYPAGAAASPSYGEVMPELSWQGAYLGDGTQRDFSLREVHCSDEFADVETILFVASSGWCPNCPAYAQYVLEISGALAAEGMLIVWVEVENGNFNPSSHAEAQTSITNYIGEGGPGIRIGDAETLPAASVFKGIQLVQAFPSQFVVRKRDMRVIAASFTTQYLMPILQVARHPDADWDNPGDNVLPTSVGEPCLSEVDCDTGTLLPNCFQARDSEGEFTGWAGGYCSGLLCNSNEACGDGMVCAQINSDGLTGCFKACAEETIEQDCRPGYRCRPIGGIFGDRVCQP